MDKYWNNLRKTITSALKEVKRKDNQEASSPNLIENTNFEQKCDKILNRINTFSTTSLANNSSTKTQPIERFEKKENKQVQTYLNELQKISPYNDAVKSNNALIFPNNINPSLLREQQSGFYEFELEQNLEDGDGGDYYKVLSLPPVTPTETPTPTSTETPTATQPTYELTVDKDTIEEGETVTFTLNTTNVPDGTIILFDVIGLGITEDDFLEGSLSDGFNIYNNTATYTFKAKNDATTEGDETMTLVLTDVPSVYKDVTIIDTSKAPPAYNVVASPRFVAEGNVLTFIITTKGVPNGTVIPYLINGTANNDDIEVGGTGSMFGGTITILADDETIPNGDAIVTFIIKEDLTTEGLESITLTIPTSLLDPALQPDPLADAFDTGYIVDTSVQVTPTATPTGTPTVTPTSTPTSTPTATPTITSTSTIEYNLVDINNDGTNIIAGAISTDTLATTENGGSSWNKTIVNSAYSIADVVSNSDGLTQAFAAQGGGIFVSNDRGLTWNERSPLVTSFRAITTSADGTKIVVAQSASPYALYTSTDSGLNWSTKAAINANLVYSLASSSDGQKLVAGVGFATTDYIYTSLDFGDTWVARTGSTKGSWRKVACSSDASTIIAFKSNTALAYISTNFGASWFTRNPFNASGVNIQSVAVSDDGQTLYILQGSDVFRSIDGGNTFVDVVAPIISVNSTSTEIACSGEGTKVVIAGILGRIYSSTDSGTSWTTIVP